MSCGNPYTTRDERLVKQLQKQEYDIASNSNLAKQYQEVYDKESGIFGFDSVFDTNLVKRESREEKPKSQPKEEGGEGEEEEKKEINVSQTIIDITPFLISFGVILFIFYSSNKRK